MYESFNDGDDNTLGKHTTTKKEKKMGKKFMTRQKTCSNIKVI